MPNIDGKTVFFAEVSNEMKKYKENLEKELKHHGCLIKEAKISEQSIDQIKETIEECDVTLHILSDKDFNFDSSGRGYEELQINYAVQHYLSRKLIADSIQNGLKIYAWHPKSASETIFKEKRIPNHLNKIQQLEEVDFIRTNFEDFKYYLLKKIEVGSSEKVEEFYIKGNDNLYVYFLFDAVDKEKAQKYTDYLEKRGFNVLVPMFEKDIIEVRKRHINSLKKFDIAIIFAVEGSANWVNMKIMDILKSPGFGREKNIKGKAVFLPDRYRQSLPPVSRGFSIISTDSGSLTDQIETFLRDLD